MAVLDELAIPNEVVLDEIMSEITQLYVGIKTRSELLVSSGLDKMVLNEVVEVAFDEIAST